MPVILISDFYNLFKKQGLSNEVIETFRKIIYAYYEQYGREFPFRSNISDYNVLVSEIMLQQTQTGAVSNKFLQFTLKFPGFLDLARAPLEEILKVWKGLGYNRRAIALKKISEIIIRDYKGKLPNSIEILKSFPQIGHNTASSIVAFAFNKPTVFIETNIRRVYIYFFYLDKVKVKDTEILSLVEKTIDKNNPREWYYALMDYGVMLKKSHPELNKKSIHYKKQKPFKGSSREIRGKILDILLEYPDLTENEIIERLNTEPERIIKIIQQLTKEGFIKKYKTRYRIMR
ncbi:MAG: winged helix-turn-helix transcriptional regulator [Promethearchaeota archaeon]